MISLFNYITNTLKSIYLKIKILICYSLTKTVADDFLLQAAKLNNINIVMILLAVYHVSPNIYDKKTKKSPLYLAAEHRNLDMMEIMLKHGASYISHNEIDNLIQIKEQEEITFNVYPSTHFMIKCITVSRENFA